MESGLDIVGFKYNDEKYCRECFYKLPPETIRFSTIRRAVIVQSFIKNCCKCGKDLTKEPSNG